MNSNLTKKTAYVGAGAGLVLFTVFGLLPGMLLGGAAGIKISGLLMAFPLDPGLLSRSLILLSMLVGVILSGMVIITGASAAGWLIGSVFETALPKPGGLLKKT